jgi:hypothetical protein
MRNPHDLTFLGKQKTSPWKGRGKIGGKKGLSVRYWMSNGESDGLKSENLVDNAALFREYRNSDR